MVRRIIQIDQAKCNGCGLCAKACHEGAIGMVNNKATLLRDDYCDGLGDCLPACPTGAITFVEREAVAYDEAAVKARQAEQGCAHTSGCPGSTAKQLAPGKTFSATAIPSQLRQWPVQLKLAPVNAPYFDGAHLLIAADCTAYAYGNFHQEYMRGRVTLIGCPKLDEGSYIPKLTQIIRDNEIQSVTVVRMEVPCCGGIEYAVKQALMTSGKFIPWRVIIIGTDGQVVQD